MTKSALKADNISVKFGGLVAVDDVSFDIPTGGVVSLIDQMVLAKLLSSMS